MKGPDQANLQARKAGQWLPRPGEMGRREVRGTAKSNRISFRGNENISQALEDVVVAVVLAILWHVGS